MPTSYTNIAILNAGNLIVLGEQFRRPEAAAEGGRRLDALCLWTAAFGLREYCSPTYYGTDLSGLLFIQRNAQSERARTQARAMLGLLWTDIAANWFPPAERLAGAHSRSYDYLCGRGALDWHLWSQGWLRSERPGMRERVEPYWNEWTPPPALREMSLRQFPRLVRQSWGMQAAESRTHMMYRDVTLSCAGSGYGSQDMPMTVDLPGPRDVPRCYFIADGREDPYGKRKYETGSAKHPKALHLEPFWAGAQRTCDALAAVVYRDKDLADPQLVDLQSHLILRRSMDAAWLGGRNVSGTLRVPSAASGTRSVPDTMAIRLGEPLVVRYGSAGLGIRLLWAARQDGSVATAALVDDGNAFGAKRLTIEHGRSFRRVGIAHQQTPIEDIGGQCPPYSSTDKTSPVGGPGAVLWIRVGSGLDSDEAFDAWRKRFEAASPRTIDVSAKRLRVEVPGVDGPVGLDIHPPYGPGGEVRLVPAPCRGVLELDGREIGRPLLAAVEPLRSFPPEAGPLEPIRVPAGKGAAWEAERCIALPGARVVEDAEASDGRCVGQPSDDAYGRAGVVLWSVDVEKSGRYYLWARVRAADDKSNSFTVQMRSETNESLAEGVWDFRPTARWQWQPLRFVRATEPAVLDLPAGLCRLEFRVRERGAWVDRLLLTPDAKEEPR